MSLPFSPRSRVWGAVACLLLAGACTEQADSNAAGISLESASEMIRADRFEAAAAELVVALEHDPHNFEAQVLHGAVLERLNRLDEAEQAYLAAQRLLPDHPDPALHLERLTRMRDLEARIEAARGNLAEATEPASAHRALADLLVERRRAEPAQRHYTQALRYDPDDAAAHAGLAFLLIQLHREVRGLYHASEALRLRPDDQRALGALVWVLATSSEPTLRAPEEAIQRAEALDQKSARLLDGLAAAYAAVGRQEEAVATARAAIDSAVADRDYALAHAIQDRLTLYQSGRAFVGPPIDPG